MKRNYLTALSALIASSALALGGCIIDPTHVEEDFGSSVRQMIAGQIYDPEAASNPDENAPALVDGVAVTRAIEGYREDAKREERRERGTIVQPEAPR